MVVSQCRNCKRFSLVLRCISGVRNLGTEDMGYFRDLFISFQDQSWVLKDATKSTPKLSKYRGVTRGDDVELPSPVSIERCKAA